MNGIQNPCLTDKGKAVMQAVRDIEEARSAGVEYDSSKLPEDVREVLVRFGDLP